jgi:hypothetical protein
VTSCERFAHGERTSDGSLGSVVSNLVPVLAESAMRVGVCVAASMSGIVN